MRTDPAGVVVRALLLIGLAGLASWVFNGNAAKILALLPNFATESDFESRPLTGAVFLVVDQPTSRHHVNVVWPDGKTIVRRINACDGRAGEQCLDLRSVTHVNVPSR